MSGTVYIGVDPGISGAVAFYFEEQGSLIVEDMPVVSIKSGKSTKNRVDEYALANMIREEIGGWTPVAFVEQVASRPGESVTASFNFGTSFGVVRGVMGALRVPTTYVTPQTWRRAVGCPEGKDGSRMRAIQVFPLMSTLLARKKDNGRSDAILIAYHGSRQAVRP